MATLGVMSLRATVNAKVDWRGRTLRPANEVFCPWAHATAPCSGLSITAASNISNYRMKRIIAEHVAPLLTEITVNACDAMRFAEAICYCDIASRPNVLERERS